MDHQSSAKCENLVSPQPLESEKPNYQPRDKREESKTLAEKSQSASHTCERNNEEEIGVKEMDSGGVDNVNSEESVVGAMEGNLEIEESGRERLKRHRVEMGGRVWIPDLWGQEEFLKDWIDCAAFDAPLRTSRIMTARAALVEERRSNTGGFRIENRC